MTGFEKRAVLSLAFLYSSRMLGLFMVLPVFIIYGQDLEGANEMLIGLAIGAYGLSQAIFQVPFGALSDRLGRKPLILAGLILFFCGSVLAASSTSIEGVIVGRFLQGAGAIASVLMALLSDLTSEESRTKAMAMIGMSIGVSFSLALILGPVVAEWQGLSGIFWLTAGLALVGMAWLFSFVPSPVQHFRNRDTRLFRDQLGEVAGNTELLRLDFGIFALHLCLTAMFVAVPFSLVQEANLPASEHWLVYLTVMVLSFFAMVPLIIIGEKRRQMKTVFVFAITLLGAASLSVQWSQSHFGLFWLSLFFFFMAFNLLEASLPSLVSKLSPAGSKGTAMGVYSTAQFLGAFVGGVSGGWLLGQWGLEAVYVFVATVCLLWLLVALFMRNPNPETGLTLTFRSAYNVSVAEALTSELSQIKGVEEVVAIPGEKLAYLKVVKNQLDENALKAVHERFDV
ncbi:MAG: MFS transporter [Oleiphilus sp.]|nr:MAG: MFS transporter [Oleiphilus sp.]